MAAIHRAPRPEADFRIEPQARAVLGGRAVKVIRLTDADHILVRVEGTCTQEWTTAGALTPYREGAIEEVVRHPAAADHGLEARAQEWHRHFSQLSAHGRLSHAQKALIAQALKTTPRTVSRHYKRFLANPMPASQVPEMPGPHPGSRLLAPAVERIIDQAIQIDHLVRERKSRTAVVARVRELCHRAGVKAPGRTAIVSRIRAIEPLKAAKARLGTHEAHGKQAPSITGLRTSAALDAVQIDHALVDLIVVNAETRQPLGRPWITIAIDVHTRCVLGYHLSFRTPDQEAVGLCVEHACFPKNDWMRELGVELAYPMFGKPRSIHWDNAKTFQALAVKAQCERYGIYCKPRLPRKPHFGAYVERFIGTFMGAMHLLRGTTFSSPAIRKDYDSERNAVFSIPELQRWVALQIGIYHCTEHKGLRGLTPSEAWAKAWRHADGTARIPPLIANRREFVLGFLPFVHRKVTREGLALFGLKYWDPALTPLINQDQFYPVHYKRSNLSRIFLRMIDSYIDVPLNDRAKRAFSYDELQESRKAHLIHHHRRANEIETFTLIEQQRAIEDVAAKTSKKARRKQARRPESARAQEKQADSVDYSRRPTLLDPALSNVP